MKPALTCLLALMAAPALALAQVDSGLGDVNPRDLFKPAPGYDPESEPKADSGLRAYPVTPEQVAPESRSVAATGATLRLLDKMNGRVETFDVAVAQTVIRARLEIKLDACRTPPAGEVADAYAYLEIRDLREAAPRFMGWMFASSPALSALDHARYDVWVLRCRTDSAEASAQSAQKSE